MLKLVPISKNSDNTYSLEFSYDQNFIEFYKQKTGAKVIRKANVGKFIQKWFKETFN